MTDGLLFVGSMYGDSQLVQLLSEPDETGTVVQEVQRWSNLGPIVDFCVVDLEVRDGLWLSLSDSDGPCSRCEMVNDVP